MTIGLVPKFYTRHFFRIPPNCLLPTRKKKGNLHLKLQHLRYTNRLPRLKKKKPQLVQEPSRNSRSGLKGFLTNHLLRPHGWGVGERCGHWGAPGAPIQELNFQVFREKYSRWREDHVRKPSCIECQKNPWKNAIILGWHEQKYPENEEQHVVAIPLPVEES